jgi:hypothetical protein
MMILRRLVIACAAAGCATAAAADAPVPNATALYSFNDLYRLTVSGAIPELPRTELREVRVAQAEPVAAPTEFTFTITPVPGPGRWPLLLAGLAACAWVAHRRLTRPL